MTRVVESTDVAAEKAIRSLTDEEFFDRYQCDRFTSTVLSNKFRYVVANMCNQFQREAFSPIIRDAADMCGMLSGPAELGYPMVAVSETVPLFYGSIPDAVPNVLTEYGIDNLVPGDVILVNDYYRTGTHLNDACTIRPVFHQGHLVGVVTIRAHLMDIGGIELGGFEITKKNTFEDGLRLPPVLLYSAGRAVKSTFQLLHANSRLGDLIVTDLRSQCSTMELAETQIIGAIEKYGMDAYLGSMRYAGDAAAEGMASALAAIPDGTYEAYETIDGDGLDDSPEYGVRLRITKVGNRAEFDFRGSSGPTRTALNCAWPDIKTGVGMGLKCLLDPLSPFTSDTLRNVDIVVPKSAILNATPPAACHYYWEVVMAVCHAVYQALNPALGENAVTASGMPLVVQTFGARPDGSEFLAMSYHSNIFAWGATRVGDGDSGTQSVFSNLRMNGGVETFEIDSPTGLLTQSTYATDSCGPGKFRGGASNVHDTLWLQPADQRINILHGRRPLAGGGVNGGKSGPLPAAFIFERPDSEAGVYVLPAKHTDAIYRDSVPVGGTVNPVTRQVDPEGEYVLTTKRIPTPSGATVRMFHGSGSGWGEPFERDPDRVCRDVRDEYVSIDGAAQDYGVVVVGDIRHPEQLSVDVAATEHLRNATLTSQSFLDPS
jgi:N-methylhydantoinase B